MNYPVPETMPHAIKMNCLQPSLVLLVSVKRDEICADSYRALVRSSDCPGVRVFYRHKNIRSMNLDFAS